MSENSIRSLTNKLELICILEVFLPDQVMWLWNLVMSRDIQAVKIVLVRGTRVGRLTAGVFSLGGHQYHPPLTPLSGYDCEQVPEPGLPPPNLAMKLVGAEQTVRGWC